MSRFRRGAAPLAAAALASVVLGPASARTPAPAKYGGTLVVGIRTGEPDTLDPTVSRTTAAIKVFAAMCQKLYDYDAKGQLLPVLAAAAPVLSKDKLTYTIQLRQGVRFNDGTPFNAQAVVTTVQRFMTYPGSTRATDYIGLDSANVAGPYTVVYHLKARDSTFIGGNPYVLSPTQLDALGPNFATKPVCVGPFMFDHRVAGDNVTLIKSHYYYDQPHVYLDKIVYKPASDAAAAAAGLKSGDLQALDQVSTTELPAVEQDSNLRVIEAPQLGFQGIAFNMGNKNGLGNLPYTPLATPLASSAKLRQAFEEAIDRNALNKIVFSGFEQVSCSPIAPANTVWYAATRVPCTPYDPKDAKKLIASSGFPNPTVRLLLTNTTDNLRLAQFIQAQEAAVGINIVIDSGDTASVNARAASGNFDTRIASNGPGAIDPNGRFYPYFATSGQMNYGGYSNPRLDLIIANGLKATSMQARSTLYRVAQQIISSDRPMIVLYNSTTIAAFNTNLTGVYLSSSGLIRVDGARYK